MKYQEFVEQIKKLGWGKFVACGHIISIRKVGFKLNGSVENGWFWKSQVPNYRKWFDYLSEESKQKGDVK